MRDIPDRLFWIAKEEEIKNAEVTDHYFLNTETALKMSKINPKVTMEIYTRHLPYSDGWGVVAGIYEVAKLLENLPVDVDAMDEGEVFAVPHYSLGYEPVMQIRGRYRDFARYETPALGFLCSASGYATKAARIRIAAGDKILLSFGTRRAHPALAPLIERCAYIAGFDGVSNEAAARMLGIEGSGTMPHSFILCYDNQQEAWKAFASAIKQKEGVIALTDTLYDEKIESIMALETLGDKLSGIRLDTPSSRRGDWRKIIEEVRWELNIRGGENVKIFISGGLDEDDIRQYKDIVAGFGVGTSVSDAPSIDFNMKLVEVEKNGRMIARAKRGDMSGAKKLWRDEDKMVDYLTPETREKPDNAIPLLKPLIRQGKIVREIEDIKQIRARVKNRLARVASKPPEVKVLF